MANVWLAGSQLEAIKALNDLGIGAVVKYDGIGIVADIPNAQPREIDKFKVTITAKGGSFEIDYSQGIGHRRVQEKAFLDREEKAIFESLNIMKPILLAQIHEGVHDFMPFYGNNGDPSFINQSRQAFDLSKQAVKRRVSLRNKGINLPEHQGVYTLPPTIADIMFAVVTDFLAVENADGFEDFCWQYGYDTDSRKALAIYEACQKTFSNVLMNIGRSTFEQVQNILEDY